MAAMFKGLCRNLPNNDKTASLASAAKRKAMATPKRAKRNRLSV